MYPIRNCFLDCRKECLCPCISYFKKNCLIFIFGCTASLLLHVDFLSCWRVWGCYSLFWCAGFLQWLLVAEQSPGSVVVAYGLSCSMACGIFLDRVCCIGRWILNPGTSREVLSYFLSGVAFENIAIIIYVCVPFIEFKHDHMDQNSKKKKEYARKISILFLYHSYQFSSMEATKLYSIALFIWHFKRFYH